MLEALGMDDRTCCYDKDPAFTLLVEPRSPFNFRSQEYFRSTIAFYRLRCKDKCWAQGAQIIAGPKGQDILTYNMVTQHLRHRDPRTKSIPCIPQPTALKE